MHSSPLPPTTGHTLPSWAGWLLWLALLTLLLAVFGLYMQPDFLVTLADQLWSCL